MARTSNSMNEQHSEGTVHVDGKNLGRFKCRAFAKYDNWSPADEDNAPNKGRRCLCMYVCVYVHNLCTLTTQATRAILEVTKMGGGRKR